MNWRTCFGVFGIFSLVKKFSILSRFRDTPWVVTELSGTEFQINQTHTCELFQSWLANALKNTSKNSQQFVKSVNWGSQIVCYVLETFNFRHACIQILAPEETIRTNRPSQALSQTRESKTFRGKVESQKLHRQRIGLSQRKVCLTAVKLSKRLLSS